MSSQFDASEFIDDDLHPVTKPGYAGATGTASAPVGAGERKAPSREEVELKVSEMQQRLAELKNEQQRLERERATLEETRRRQSEFTTGRQEMIQNLTRSIALMEEAELNHRREAEQRSKVLVDLREALGKVISLNQESWNKENFEMELTRGMTTVDNSRMEWNSARVKFAELNGKAPGESAGGGSADDRGVVPVGGGLPQSFGDLCRLGFAINWPLFVLGLMIFLMLWLRR
jgi:septal ring factor EnvC (AmiA/AmiB activator)